MVAKSRSWSSVKKRRSRKDNKDWPRSACAYLNWKAMTMTSCKTKFVSSRWPNQRGLKSRKCCESRPLQCESTKTLQPQDGRNDKDFMWSQFCIYQRSTTVQGIVALGDVVKQLDRCTLEPQTLCTARNSDVMVPDRGRSLEYVQRRKLGRIEFRARGLGLIDVYHG